ncbi:MAG: DUF255 domain-containing protein [Nitrospirota bacterium]
MKYIKSGTKWLLFFLMVAALAGTLTSCAAENHAGMPARPVAADPPGIRQRLEGPIAPPGPAAESDASATSAPSAPRAVQAQPSHAAYASNDKNTVTKIDWVPWSDAAFARARAENKLVFLEISSRWSAWPGEPGRGFPSDPETAEIIEKNYIPVYNDADRRPDVYEQYGRGGLPSLSILNPDGYVLASANAMTAPELKNLITMLAKNYEKNKSLIDGALRNSSNITGPKPAKEEYPLEKMPEGTLAALAARWDHVYGGIGRKKFPMPEALDFLLYVSTHPEYQDGIDPKPMAETALDGMAAGLFDRTEGGFFRYSDTPDWKSPHKEKLLGLNSELIITYLTAYETYGDKEYLRIGESSALFLRKYLLDEKARAFMNSRTEGLQPDSTIFADGNGKAALAFLEAYRVTGKREYLATALNSLDYVINNLYNKKVGVAHFAGAGGWLALSDQVLPGLAAARAYEATADAKYLDFAVDIGEICDRKFYDPNDYGFYGFWYDKTPPGWLQNKKKPQAENAKMSELLLTLQSLTGRDRYREAAKKTVVPFIPAYRKYPALSAPVALAAARLVSTTCQFFVVGRKSEPGFGELLDESYRFEDPDRVAVPLEADRDKDRIKELGYGHENTPTLYICSANACFSPVKPGESMESVRKVLKKCKEAERRQKYGR